MSALTPKHLAAACVMVALKPFARAESLAELGVGYSPTDPTIAELVSAGLVAVRGKALCPDRKLIHALLAKHPYPREYDRTLGHCNGCMVFGRTGVQS